MDNHVEQAAQNNTRTLRRRRMLKCLLIFLGIALIIGCLVMASYSYIFLDDCKESSCHEASAEEITTAKVFRFISAGLFIIGVFMVAFSLCTNKGNREVENTELRRISLHTVACVIPDSAKEKSPSVLCSRHAYCNPGLSGSVPGLNGIPELPENLLNIDCPTASNYVSSESIRELFVRETYEEDLSRTLTPPPSYSEALKMQIPQEPP